MHGDMERWFEPIEDEVGSGATLTTILTFARNAFGQLAPSVTVACGDSPVPHRGGLRKPAGRRPKACIATVSITCSSCWSRGRTSRVGDDDPRAAGAMLGQFTLTNAFDSAIVDDHRVAHGVTPVVPLDPAAPPIATCSSSPSHPKRRVVRARIARRGIWLSFLGLSGPGTEDGEPAAASRDCLSEPDCGERADQLDIARLQLRVWMLQRIDPHGHLALLHLLAGFFQLVLLLLLRMVPNSDMLSSRRPSFTSWATSQETGAT